MHSFCILVRVLGIVLIAEAILFYVDVKKIHRWYPLFLGTVGVIALIPAYYV